MTDKDSPPKDADKPKNAPGFASITPSPEEPAFAELAQLGQWLRAGKTTPTRLATYFLDRLERLGPKYNALVTLTRERAQREAKRAEEELAAGKDRGPLHGIPYGVKDLLATKDYPTSWGAEPYREQKSEEDATVIQRFGEAGAVLIGKLAMVEIAGGMGYQQADASFTGPGLNPWNIDAWSGGSSTGPGSAVGAGLVPFAIGSETWGSIVTPASYCGITGLRPTYGRISRSGAMALSWTLDKLGPMARSASDCAMILAAIAGPDPRDPTALPERFEGMAPRLDRKLRLAVYPRADRRLQKEVGVNYRRSLELLGELGELVEIDPPPDLPYDATTALILSAEIASAFEDLIGSEQAKTLRAPEDHIGGIANGFILAKDYIRALRIRGKAIAALDEWLRPFDALVTPSMAAVACPVDGSFREYFAGLSAPRIGGLGNLVGLPCVCLPNGFGERGLPSGLSLLGRARSESQLLRVAHEIQQRTDWHRKYPKV